MNKKEKLFLALCLVSAAWFMLVVAPLAIYTDNICKDQELEGGSASFTLHTWCYSHKHYMGRYVPEVYTVDGIFVR